MCVYVGGVPWPVAPFEQLPSPRLPGWATLFARGQPHLWFLMWVVEGCERNFARGSPLWVRVRWGWFSVAPTPLTIYLKPPTSPGSRGQSPNSPNLPPHKCPGGPDDDDDDDGQEKKLKEGEILVVEAG